MNIRNARVSKWKEKQILVQSSDSGCLKPRFGRHSTTRYRVQIFSVSCLSFFILSNFCVLFGCIVMHNVHSLLLLKGPRSVLLFHFYSMSSCTKNSHNWVMYDFFPASLWILQLIVQFSANVLCVNDSDYCRWQVVNGLTDWFSLLHVSSQRIWWTCSTATCCVFQRTIRWSTTSTTACPGHRSVTATDLSQTLISIVMGFSLLDCNLWNMPLCQAS